MSVLAITLLTWIRDEVDENQLSGY
jgi:hypothetical protein